jgi:hypothetical protein
MVVEIGISEHTAISTPTKAKLTRSPSSHVKVDKAIASLHSHQTSCQHHPISVLSTPLSLYHSLFAFSNCRVQWAALLPSSSLVLSI